VCVCARACACIKCMVATGGVHVCVCVRMCDTCAVYVSLCVPFVSLCARAKYTPPARWKKLSRQALTVMQRLSLSLHEKSSMQHLV
jgi:hypothetical protein